MTLICFFLFDNLFFNLSQYIFNMFKKNYVKTPLKLWFIKIKCKLLNKMFLF